MFARRTERVGYYFFIFLQEYSILDHSGVDYHAVNRENSQPPPIPVFHMSGQKPEGRNQKSSPYYRPEDYSAHKTLSL